MKRALLLLLFSLASCQPITPGPARYSCSRDLPDESQCAAGWRCGLDGFCFNPDGTNPVALSCADSARDCPTGWRCGLAGTCFDPASPSGAALPCKTPETDCPTGFKCSLDGFCFDPANPTAASLPCKDPERDCPTDFKCGLDARCLAPDVTGPWRCEDTTRDCTGGWTCGARGVCFDRADAGRVECRAGVSTDCNEGWRCGIDGLCQQRDAGFPWPCRADADCEANWRCSPDGLCLDPSADALRPNAGMPQGVRFDLGWPGADDLALGERFFVECGGDYYSPALAGAVRRGRQVDVFAVASEGGPGLPTSCDGGEPGGFGPFMRGHVDFTAEEPLELDQQQGITLVRVDGGVRQYQLVADGRIDSLGFVPGSFRRLHGSREVQTTLASGDRSVVAINYGVTVLNNVSLVAVDGGPARVNDVVLWKKGSDELLVAATDRGLFAKPVDWNDGGAPWTQVGWSGLPVTMQELRLAPQPDGGPMPVMVLVQETLTGTTRAWTFVPTLAAGDGGLPPVQQVPPNSAMYAAPVSVGAHAWTFAWAEMYVFCNGPTRGWLMGVERGAARSTAWALLQCALADGGTQLKRTVVNPFSNATMVASSDEEEPLSSGARWLPNDDRTAALLDPRGGVTLASTSGRDLQLEPWLPSAVPEAVAGTVATSALARTPERALRLGETLPQATVAELHFLSSPDGGWLRLDTKGGKEHDVFRLLSPVEGRPDLAVFELRSPIETAAVLVEADDAGVPGFMRAAPLRVKAKSDASASPLAAAVSTSVDGGGLWFVSHEGELRLSELGPSFPVRPASLDLAPDLVPLPRARLAVTPLPGANITHVLGLPADAATGAGYGQALIVAAGRLFHVRAENPVVWRATEPLATPSEILKSWRDGARVRIGDRAGRVIAYPSRVALAQPFTDGALAWDFTDVCGVTYALATTGLWRLAAQPGVPLGSWTRVPLPAGLALDTQGRLFTDGTELLVFDARGASTRVEGLTCAQPL